VDSLLFILVSNGVHCKNILVLFIVTLYSCSLLYSEQGSFDSTKCLKHYLFGNFYVYNTGPQINAPYNKRGIHPIGTFYRPLTLCVLWWYWWSLWYWLLLFCVLLCGWCCRLHLKHWFNVSVTGLYSSTGSIRTRFLQCRTRNRTFLLRIHVWFLSVGSQCI
jgi:hypothetical protein